MAIGARGEPTHHGPARRRSKRILRKHGYPPDNQAKAVQTVLEQAEQLSWEMAA